MYRQIGLKHCFALKQKDILSECDLQTIHNMIKIAMLNFIVARSSKHPLYLMYARDSSTHFKLIDLYLAKIKEIMPRVRLNTQLWGPYKGLGVYACAQL